MALRARDEHGAFAAKDSDGNGKNPTRLVVRTSFGTRRHATDMALPPKMGPPCASLANDPPAKRIFGKIERNVRPGKHFPSAYACVIGDTPVACGSRAANDAGRDILRRGRCTAPL